MSFLFSRFNIFFHFLSSVPKRVPQMAEPEAVLDALDVPESTVIAGLALNERGVDRALETRVGEIRYSFGVSETFNQRNQGKTGAESFAMLTGGREGTASALITALQERLKKD